jgi:outer membrane lipoprotein-sorting protein
MNNSVHAKVALWVLTVLAICSLSVAQAYVPQPFSGDFSSTSPNGNKVNGKLYFSPPSVRYDVTEKGQNVSIITDGSTQTNYIVMHDRRMYMETHSNQPNPFTRQMPFVPKDFDPKNPCAWAAQRNYTCKPLGTETVNGRVCDKYQGTSQDGKTSGTVWIDQKLHFWVKAVSSDGGSFDVTNIKEGRPDASLFQPPTGYQKMNIPGMTGGRPPQ